MCQEFKNDKKEIIRMKINKYLVIRELKIWDVIKLYKMYNSLSDESKRYFHPFPEIAFNQPYSLFTWITLALSSIKILRKLLLKVAPHLLYITVCGLYLNEIVGFAFIKLKNRYYGELGIGIKDDFQGMGIGSKLMNNLISLARKEELRRIRLTVMVDNYRAIKLYEKFGFKKTKFIKNGDEYHGKKYDVIEMWLDLP
jgi:ribosomal protein S18 acetylase RimI-like enzyme